MPSSHSLSSKRRWLRSESCLSLIFLSLSLSLNQMTKCRARHRLIPKWAPLIASIPLFVRPWGASVGRRRETRRAPRRISTPISQRRARPDARRGRKTSTPLIAVSIPEGEGGIDHSQEERREYLFYYPEGLLRRRRRERRRRMMKKLYLLYAPLLRATRRNAEARNQCQEATAGEC